MTAREYMEYRFPKLDMDIVIGKFCPEEFGLHDRCIEETHEEKDCKKCWDLEIPDTTDTPTQPQILDSGNRREFETGAVRDMQEGKGRCDLLPLDIIGDLLDSEILYNIDAFQHGGDREYLRVTLEIFTRDCFDRNIYTVILELAKHFENGAKKYGERNWEKGIPVRCYIDSAVRHYLKFRRGDTNEPHDRAFVWNIVCAIWTCEHMPELNEYAREDKGNAASC